MTTVDMLVKGGTVVTPNGSFNASLVIDEGKIVAIKVLDDGIQADVVIDATGKHVLPGVIDAHAHFGIDKERSFEVDCGTESASAAGGGVTTVVNYMMDKTPYKEAIPRYFETAAKVSVTDIVLNAVLMMPEQIQEIDACVALGVTSFKLFMNREGRYGLTMDDGIQYEIFEAIERAAGLAKLHCENFEIAKAFIERAKKSGLKGLPAWDAGRPALCEYENISRAIILAEATGCPIYVVHTSIGNIGELVRRARDAGVNMTVETCPHYLALTKDNTGILGKVAPPLRSDKDVEGLWDGIRRGYVNCLGSDHVSRCSKERIKDGEVWTTANGFPGTETILPVLLSEGVSKRSVPIERVAEISAFNTAVVHGIKGKGALVPSYDADIAVVDLKKEVKITNETFHSASDVVLFEGRVFNGWPVTTVVRGTKVMEDGEVIGKPGTGRGIRTAPRVPALQ